MTQAWNAEKTLDGWQVARYVREGKCTRRVVLTGVATWPRKFDTAAAARKAAHEANGL